MHCSSYIRLASRRLGLVILVLVVFSAVVVAEGIREEPSVGTSQLQPLTILVPQSVSSIPVLAVADAFPGSYSVSFFTDHPQALARLLSAEVEVLMTGYSVGLRRYLTESDLVHVATPVWGASALMTAEDVDSWQDLRGGVVYAPFEGSPIDIYVQKALEAEGLTGEVEVRYAPFPQSSALLAEGNADAAVLVEPIASRLEATGAAYRLENLHEGWGRLSGGEQRSPQVSFFVNDSTATEYRNSLSTFIERLDETLGNVVAAPEAYAERYAPVLDFPQHVVEQALRNTLFDLPSASETRQVIGLYSEMIGSDEPNDEFYLED
ncbi:MAG: ABC transporter substrate-binding protein [Spirochaetota bacterium]